jgi:hypothetical protein
MRAIRETAPAVNKMLPIAYCRPDGIPMIRTGPDEAVNPQMALILRLLPAARDEEEAA